MSRSVAAGFDALTVAEDERIVYRVGYPPDAFSWTPWQYADAGRFNGRWDDPEGRFRTLYVADRLLGCLLEVLADFRPDLTLVGELDAIVDDAGDSARYPTSAAGLLPRSWLAKRRVGRARMRGGFVDVRAATTIAALRTLFGPLAAKIGLPDLDAAAIKLSAPRTLTQQIAGWLYRFPAPVVSGVCFGSRFADSFTLWAIFEQPGEDRDGSATLTRRMPIPLTPQTPELVEAMGLHGLTWTD